MACLTRPAQAGLRVVRTSNPETDSDDAVSRGLDGVFLSIAPPLCRLLGRDGYRALLERALKLAGADYPLLRTVRPAIAPAGRLVGLPDVSSRNEQVFDALAATLTAMLELLVQLLGPELVEHILGGDADWRSSPSVRRQVTGSASA